MLAVSLKEIASTFTNKRQASSSLLKQIIPLSYVSCHVYSIGNRVPVTIERVRSNHNHLNLSKTSFLVPLRTATVVADQRHCCNSSNKFSNSAATTSTCAALAPTTSSKIRIPPTRILKSTYTTTTKLTVEGDSSTKMTGSKVNTVVGGPKKSSGGPVNDTATAAASADPVDAAAAPGPVELLTSPVKGVSDRKEYRSLRLSNGLHVLLVSDRHRHGQASAPADWEGNKAANDDEDSDEDEADEESEGESSDEEGEEDDDEASAPGTSDSEYKAAASLAVSWGSSEGPPELLGFMHFLEHMVFMGSAKYPKENSFDDFIRRHGGGDNAYTDNEHTNFHFDVHEAYLWESLDRFSQFFVNPLMKKNAMERERNAVDSEFTLALPSDGNREQQLLSLLAHEGHPLSLFTWGNAASLSVLPDDQVHAMLHKKRERYYSAQYMTLALQSRHTLDDMQEQVNRIFSLVPNNGLPAPDRSHHPFPFPASAVNKIIKMEAMKAKHTVVVTWFLPPMLKDYRRQPLRLLANLIGHEGHGSLLSFYKQQNWSCGVAVECEESDFDHGSFCSQLRVHIDLTEEGFHKVEQVLLALFQYTALLRTHPPSQQMFEEFQKLARLNVDFEEESEPIENVEALTACMLLFPSEDYLTGKSLMFEFDPQFMKELTALLTHDTCNIILRSRLLGDFADEETQTEKWFGTKYRMEEISEEWRKLFSTAETTANPALYLPLPNPFIPTDFSLLPVPSPPPSSNQLPKVVVSQPHRGQLFYKPDHKFELPSVQIKVRFLLQKLPERETSKFLDVMNTLLQCYRYQLLEPAYDAVLAKCGYRMNYSIEGLVLSISGFSQIVGRLLTLLMDHLENFTKHFEEKHFDTLKDLELRKIYNNVSKPSDIRTQLRLHLLLPQCTLPLEHLQLMQTVTADDVTSCASNLLRNANIDMLVQGNITEAAATELYETVQRHIPRDQPVEGVQYLVMPGYRVLPEGVTVVRVGTTNKADGNSAVSNYYQGDPGSLRSQILLDFVSSAMEEQCFDTLRTREQLAYIVYCQANESNGVIGFSLHVTPQAEKFSTHHVDTRIEAFLCTFSKHMKDLSAQDFATLKETVIKMKKIDDLSLDEEFSRNWSEIFRNELLFDRLQRQIALLDSITKEEVVSFYESLVSPELNGYRKLSIQVVGCVEHKTHDPPPLQEMLDGGVSCLQFLSRPPQEDATPATCPTTPVFVQQCNEYISKMCEKPAHLIVH